MHEVLSLIRSSVAVARFVESSEFRTDYGSTMENETGGEWSEAEQRVRHEEERTLRDPRERKESRGS